jgi:hypothetical protein
MSQAARILALWEAAVAADAHALPARLLQAEGAAIDADAVPLGQRDPALLRVRQALFGRELAVSARGPDCATLVEFTTDIETILAAGASARAATVEIGGQAWPVRAPSATDLRAIAALPDAAAREALALRCLDGARAPETLDERALEAIEAALEDADPLASIDFALVCAACGHGWEAALEPASYLMTELSVGAARLFEEVAALARAYGWSEPEILALSPARRRIYRELAS